MDPSTRTSTSTLARSGVLVVAIGAAALGGFALGRRSIRRDGATTHSAPASIDPVAIVPHGTRFVVAADIARARTAASTSTLFASVVGEDCRSRLAPRVQRLFVFARDATLDDSAFVFEGQVSRDELAQCLREGRPNLDRGLVRYRGIELSRAVSQRPRELLPSQDSNDVATLPGGLVVAGPSSAVASIIDRALDPAQNTAQSALGRPLAALHERLERGYTLAVLSLARPTSGRLGSLLANVEGIAVSFHARERLRIEAHFVCDNFDTPRTLTDVLSSQREQARADVQLASIQRILGEVRIERLANGVRITSELSADDVSTVVAAVRLALATAVQAPDAAGDQPPALEPRSDGGSGGEAGR